MFNSTPDGAVNDLANGTLGNSAIPSSRHTFPYGSKRYSFNGSNTSLTNTPAAPVGQPSFSFHQRAGSNSSSSRTRPRSFFGGEPTSNPIWEDDTGSSFGGMDASADTEKLKHRYSANFSSRRASYTPTASLLPPAEPRTPRLRSGSPSRSSSPVRQQKLSPSRQRTSSPAKKQPFSFGSQELTMLGISGSPSLVAKPAHRKGHRYKHSSVSMNLFQEPIPIAEANNQPNLIPDLYPIPNFKESSESASDSQKFKLAMSLVHSLTSVVVFLTGFYTQQQAFSTLAHLIFYDSLGSLMTSCVDVMSNFEVWSKSSIAYPFGLGRLEVLTSFALSTSLVMVGCDLVSHFIEELVLGIVDPSMGDSTEHSAHHIHGTKENGAVDWLLYELVLMLVFAVTWVTSTYILEQTPLLELVETMGLKNRSIKDTGLLASQTRHSQQKAFTQRVRNMLKILIKNPIRLLTLLYSAFFSVVPVIPENLKEQFGFDLNESSTLVVASLLCYAGWNLVKTLGGILLISFPYSDYDFTVTKASILDRVQNLACFKAAYRIDKLHFTKANPRLYLAGVVVHMKGASSDDESRMTFEINRIIVQTMKNFESDCEVETTISADRL
ncbi:hypothetical protein METBIDRAFT_41604 [Metschnikowia bicuspidata var. bicuspidata NRRL YB-4993]|uniref:Cation efflux protein n=1 Tax=Metschnikowia bicuspidata var. bicuspidata NRRL YB-4993 TaxID=869754 RepID=A0A1A0HC10_9ASCO|nr:hypothetical protein METBIDRAFT_41604 [Metschnikowia bicuspidata var. bicuspidata NRRL YB-4993]OBA21428.1 hypothetical protein METBIDRAFT_41604 [Metschnikowia bicuspidata var. bicuspidata NRRL YB-4993]